MAVIATVLKSGGEYQPGHVQRLHAQFHSLPSVCLSDVPVAGVRILPMRYNWRGWFAKMELFNPDLIAEDLLFFDLDTVITGDISPYLTDSAFRMLSDFYHPEKPASGMMFIPHAAKAAIWEAWIDNPARWMVTCRGDQDVLEKVCGRDVARFGSGIKSYKVHVACEGMPGWNSKRSVGDGSVPPGTDVLCFHGRPRPWDTKLDRIKALSGS